MRVKLKSGGYREIPSDYTVHLASKQGHYINKSNLQTSFVSIEYKKGVKRYATRIEDNPVFKFINELGDLDFEYDTIDGLKTFMAALTAMQSFDDYGYLSNMNLITYGVDKIKELDDRERFISRLEMVEKQLELIKMRVTDSDLQDELSNIISIMDGGSDGNNTTVE